MESILNSTIETKLSEDTQTPTVFTNLKRGGMKIRSCQKCRKGKKKCEPHLDGVSPCKRCSRLGCDCIYGDDPLPPRDGDDRISDKRTNTQFTSVYQIPSGQNAAAAAAAAAAESSKLVTKPQWCVEFIEKFMLGNEEAMKEVGIHTCQNLILQSIEMKSVKSLEAVLYLAGKKGLTMRNLFSSEMMGKKVAELLEFKKTEYWNDDVEGGGFMGVKNFNRGESLAFDRPNFFAALLTPVKVIHECGIRLPKCLRWALAPHDSSVMIVLDYEGKITAGCEGKTAQAGASFINKAWNDNIFSLELIEADIMKGSMDYMMLGFSKEDVQTSTVDWLAKHEQLWSDQTPSVYEKGIGWVRSVTSNFMMQDFVCFSQQTVVSCSQFPSEQAGDKTNQTFNINRCVRRKVEAMGGDGQRLHDYDLKLDDGGGGGEEEEEEEEEKINLDNFDADFGFTLPMGEGEDDWIAWANENEIII